MSPPADVVLDPHGIALKRRREPRPQRITNVASHQVGADNRVQERLRKRRDDEGAEMGRRVLFGALLIAIGAAAGAFAVRSHLGGEQMQSVGAPRAAQLANAREGSTSGMLGDRAAS